MRFKYLDGLRGLAALIVIIDHFAISFFPAAVDADAQAHHSRIEPIIQHTPLHILVAGNFSVCVFFVLSGFVLSSKFLRTGERKVLINGAGKRYFRLAIPVLASVMLAWLLITTHAFHAEELAGITGSDWLHRFWREQPSWWQAIYHALIGVFVSGQSDKFNTVLWTMKTELVGSFLVFATLLAVGRWRWRALIYLALAIALIHTYYVAFIAGLAICDYHINGSQAGQRWLDRLWLPIAAVGIYLGSCPVGSTRGTPFEYLQGRLPIGLSVPTIAHIIGAIGLVVAVMHARPLQRWLTTKPMVWLGAASFSLYLTHFLIMGSFSSYLFTNLANNLSYTAAFLITLVPSFLLMLLAAHLFTKYIDEPAITFSSRLPKPAKFLRLPNRHFFQRRATRS
jgi:peptidoglycan/LPS O-acetylase OafA/YrhL